MEVQQPCTVYKFKNSKLINVRQKVKCNTELLQVLQHTPTIVYSTIKSDVRAQNNGNIVRVSFNGYQQMIFSAFYANYIHQYKFRNATLSK